MSEVQHRSRRHDRRDCAFGYLTVEPIDGNLEGRYATVTGVRTDLHPTQVANGSAKNEPAVLVFRRHQRRTVEFVG